MAHPELDDIIALAEDGRIGEALAALDAVLAEANDVPRLHAVRALLLLDAGRLEDARRAAELAHALDDEDPVPLHVLGRVALVAGEPLEALGHAHQALLLDPADHEAMMLEARGRAMLGQWDDAVARTESVLRADPDHAEAAILRVAALEARSAGGRPLDAAEWDRLAERFPHVAVARTGRAWTLLRRGRARNAESEFRDALALDPSDPWAREGLVLALKARYPGYTLLLRFFFWLQSLPPGTQTAVLIGGVVGTRVLRGVAAAVPALAPVVTVVVGAYFAFVLVTWLADPLLDLTLLARAEGRRLLDADARRGALAVGGTLGAALLLALVALGGFAPALGAAATVGFSSLTVAAAFHCAPGAQRRGLLVASGVFMSCGLASMAVAESTADALVILALVGVVLGTWVSRSLIRRSHRRAR